MKDRSRGDATQEIGTIAVNTETRDPGIVVSFAICTVVRREDGSGFHPEGSMSARWLHTLIVQRRMLHYVHMLDMPAASIESFARLPNDA